ncbi:MAG: cytochrome c [Pseudomonadota bacterium]
MISKLMCLALLLLGVSCGKSESKTTPAAAGLSAGFGTNCTTCHGSAATGGSAKSLKNYAGGQDAFTSAIRTGTSGMPQTFTTSQYSDADLLADYNFLKSVP